MRLAMLPDTNVLVAAYRADHPHHMAAVDWLEPSLNAGKDGQLLMLPMPVISGFVRLVTNAKIFPDASSSSHAIEFIDWLLDHSCVRVLSETSEWPEFRNLVLGKQLAGNHIPVAWLAALSLSLSENFVTFDKGFRQLLPRSLLHLLPISPVKPRV